MTTISNPALATHRDEILRIAERHGARNVRVFGSIARGSADAESEMLWSNVPADGDGVQPPK